LLDASVGTNSKPLEPLTADGFERPRNLDPRPSREVVPRNRREAPPDHVDRRRGASVAALLYRVWSLPTPYRSIAIGAFSYIRRSSVIVRRLLLVFFCILGRLHPLCSRLQTNTELTGILLYSGVIGIGLPDLLLVGLYGTWFLRIFAARSARIHRLEKNDALVGLLILAYIWSIPGTPDQWAAVFAVGYLLRFALVYFTGPGTSNGVTSADCSSPSSSSSSWRPGSLPAVPDREARR
jgi:hypothetical protein